MPNINHVVLAGHMTRDPELSYTAGNTPVVSFGIAINEKWKDHEKTNFFDCKAFGQTAEFINKFFTKGKAILFTGKLDYSTWETQEGQRRTKVEVIVDRAQFIGGEAKKEEPPRRPERPAARPVREPGPPDELLPLDDGSDIPF